jgi:hypothetical protein
LIPDELTHRWSTHQPIAGVAFLLNDSVRVVSGPYAGHEAAIITLLQLGPDPLYDIELGDGRTVSTSQSALLPAAAKEEPFLLGRLQRWYAAQCDGDWEHDVGPSISTLDNPGWRVSLPLHGTPLAGVPFTRVERAAGPRDWFACWVQDGRFEGAGGPHQLGVILGIFLQWAEGRMEAV